MRKLSGDYPNAQIVLAHCGRCYLPHDMKLAIRSIRDLDNVYMETSMVMDPPVLQMVLEEIDFSRVLFATDFPVSAMASLICFSPNSKSGGSQSSNLLLYYAQHPGHASQDPRAYLLLLS